MRNRIRQLEYEHFSANYYYHADHMEEHKAAVHEALEQLREAETQLQKWETELHLLECAELRETLEAKQAMLAEEEQALAVAQAKDKDLAPERNAIGQLLLRHDEEQISLVESEITKNEKATAISKSQEDTGKEQQSSLTAQINSKNAEKGKLAQAIESYDKIEDSYAKRYQVNLARNITREYEVGTLDIHYQEIERSISEKETERVQRIKRRETIGIQLQQQQNLLYDMVSGIEKLRGSLSDAENRNRQFETDLQERRLCLRYIGLDENALFDRALIIQRLQDKQSELDEEIRRLTLQEAALDNELRGLKSGKTIELPDSMVQVMNSLNIRIVSGMTLLKQNGSSETENRLLVKEHPFLPYSLVMTEKELASLLASEEKIYTSFPIPIVTRESLSENAEAGQQDISGVHFYMLFNDNLLNS